MTMSDKLKRMETQTVMICAMVLAKHLPGHSEENL